MRATSCLSAAFLILLLAAPAWAQSECDRPEVLDSGPCARLECLRDASPCAADAAAEACAPVRAEFEETRREIAACKARLKGRMWKGLTEEHGLSPEYETADRDIKRQRVAYDRLAIVIITGIGLLIGVFWLRRFLRAEFASQENPEKDNGEDPQP